MAEFDSAANWPLVGRSAVLADIGAGLRARGVVLAGPVGVGKTRLAREALERARSEGREIEWLAATREGASIPFAAVAPLLAHDEPLDANPVELLRRTADRLAARSEPLPVVVGVDDAHALDAWSATLIHQLTVRGLVTLLASVRTGEPAPDAITALWKDGTIRRIRVPALDASAIDELLDHCLGAPIEGVTRGRLRALAAGSPLLLRESLIGAYEDGVLERREGVWVLDRTPGCETRPRAEPADPTPISHERDLAAGAWALLSVGHCREVLDLVSSAQDRQDRLLARPMVVLANAYLGRLNVALAAAGLDRARTVSRGDTMCWGTTLLDWAGCIALQLAGRMRDARTLAEGGYAAAVAQGVREVAAGWAVLRGGIAKARGKVVTAQTALREAVAAIGGGEGFRLAGYLLADLAGAAALAGNATASARWMERAQALRNDAGRMVEPWLELNRAWLIAADGDTPRAARHIRRAAALAGELEQFSVEAIALYDAARLGEAPVVLPRLGELAKTIDGSLVAAFNAAANALATADGDALDHATGALADIGLTLHAAETAAAATRAHLAAGRPARAAASRALMTAFSNDCEGAVTPLLVPGAAPAVSLSPREQEIAGLAAAGLSSRVIAERLSLSARTVDNHLGRVYAKLGIGDRRELATVFHTCGNGRHARR